MFYVHFLDPGFPDPPWPGERRLGPFLTADEAFAQAVNDVAYGHVAEDGMLGVFAEADSIKRRTATEKAWGRHEGEHAFDPRTVARAGRPKKTTATIVQAAMKQRQEMLVSRAEAMQDQRAALEQMLPAGIDVDSFIQASDTLAAAARTRAKKSRAKAKR